MNKKSVPRVLSTPITEFQIIFERDPAACSWLEILFCCPELQTLLFHRFDHWLYRLGIPFILCLISY
jgi:serine O-acetyltransferase